MSKRFYDKVTISNKKKAGFGILLDDKPLYTPAKAELVVPNYALAQEIASEWRQQGNDIIYQQLAMTSFAALVLDVIAPNPEAVLQELLAYGDTDLLLYREDREPELYEQQNKQWQPWVEWAQQEFATNYIITTGIMPVAQPDINQNKHSEVINKSYNKWQLAALIAVAKDTTSLILAHGFMQHKLDAEQLFLLSRLEENFNISKWGQEPEMIERAAMVQANLYAAQKWRDLLAGNV